MIEVAKEVLDFLIQAGVSTYTIVMVFGMSTFIFIVLMLLKKPIKLITGHISNERLRKFANKTIILLAFAVSISLWYLAHKIAPSYFEFDVIEVVLSGAMPVVAYAIGDGVIQPANAKTIITTVNDIVEDKKVTSDDIEKISTVVKEEVVKSSKSKKQKASDKSDAENFLENLLKK